MVIIVKDTVQVFNEDLRKKNQIFFPSKKIYYRTLPGTSLQHRHQLWKQHQHFVKYTVYGWGMSPKKEVPVLQKLNFMNLKREWVKNYLHIVFLILS